MVFGLFGRRGTAHGPIWKAIADELGGCYQPAKGFLDDTDRLEVTLDGVAVIVETYTVETSRHRPLIGPERVTKAYTRIGASYLHGPGPRMRVYEHGSAAATATIEGIVEQRFDDPHFDARFEMRADDGAVARRLWTREAKLLLAKFADITVRGTAERVELVHPGGVWAHREMILDGIRLAAVLAKRDLYGDDHLRRIPGGMFAQTAGERPRVELDTGVRVIVRAEIVGDCLVMVAHTTERGGVPRTIEIVGGKVDPSLLPAAALMVVREVGTATLAIDDTGMRLAWTEIEIEPARLRAGAELLGGIAVSGPSVYR